jgi:cytochrome c oxidase subunit II
MKRLLATIAASACSSPPAPTPAPAPPAPPTDGPGLVVLERAPSDALVLQVRVIRWRCVVTDAQGVEDDVLHVPIGRAIRLVLANRDSFADLDVAIVGTPARAHLSRAVGTAELAFRIERPGSYAWQCPTEPAPKSPPESATHAIEALAPDAYAAYQAAHREAVQPTTRDGRIALAKKLVDLKGCTACHTVDGSPRVGPSLFGLWGTTVALADGRTRVVDAGYVETSLKTPTALHRPDYPPSMPSYDGQLKPWEIDAIVIYIESLGAATH